MTVPTEHSLEHGGRTYVAARIDDDREKAWARWLFRLYREIEKEAHADGETTADEYRSRLNELDDLYFQGEFSILSERGAAALPTRAGVLMLTRVIFGLDQAGAMELLTALPVEVPHLIHTIMRESFPMLAKAEAEGPKDGNAKKKPVTGHRPIHPRGTPPSRPSSSITSS